MGKAKRRPALNETAVIDDQAFGRLVHGEAVQLRGARGTVSLILSDIGFHRMQEHIAAAIDRAASDDMRRRAVWNGP